MNIDGTVDGLIFDEAAAFGESAYNNPPPWTATAQQNVDVSIESLQAALSAMGVRDQSPYLINGGIEVPQDVANRLVRGGPLYLQMPPPITARPDGGFRYINPNGQDRLCAQPYWMSAQWDFGGTSQLPDVLLPVNDILEHMEERVIKRKVVLDIADL